MWQFIKSLNGFPDTNSPNEVLKVNGQRIVSTKKKADKFMQHYASVRKLKFNKEERKLNLRLRRLLDSTPPESDDCLEFSMNELETAIKRMRRRGAPGPDDIPPAFLKELGPIALQELIDICNLSLHSAEVPQW